MPREKAFEVPVSTETVIQADIGGVSIAFTGVVMQDELNAWIDVRMNAIDRQRARQELTGVLTDVISRRNTLARFGDLERDLIRKRAELRVRLRAEWEAEHEVSGRRGEFQLTTKYKAALASFDNETEKKRQELYAEKAKCETELPEYEKRLARTRAIIDDGQTRANTLEKLESPAKLAEAAD